MTYRRYANLLGGTVDVALSDTDTTLESSDLVAMEEITSGAEELYLTLDETGSAGAPEIVRVTAHPSAADTVTIQRGQWHTLARAHAMGVSWAHDAVADDYASARLVPVDEETGTSYTVVAGDHGQVKVFTNASLVTVTLPDGLPVGFLTHLLFTGAAGGAIQDNGTSVVHGEGDVAQHGEASALVHDADEWNVQGTT